MLKKRLSGRTKAFTLIELLIVIAIILILVAIALPNFLEAQIRAKVTKAAGDLRSIGQALDAYYLEWGYYPYESESTWSRHTPGEEDGLKKITTPIPYITEIPEDPFPYVQGSIAPSELQKYYGGGCLTEDIPQRFHWVGPIYMTHSRGPSGITAFRATVPNIPYNGEVVSYSATNGTKSLGSIHHFSGEGAWWGIHTETGSVNLCAKRFLKEPERRIGMMVDKRWYLGTRPPNTF